MNQYIRWEDLLNKEAIGIDKCDLGKVQQIKDDTIITEKGIINKKRYFLPKKLIDKFNGNILYFKIMKAEAKQFRHN
jgi:predicted membrane protein